MGIVFDQRSGVCRPRYVCDVCEQAITHQGDGLVVYEEPPPGEEATTTRVFLAHKNPACRTRLWAMVGCPDDTGWRDELASHLVSLATGVGMFPEEFQEEYELMLAKGEVPSRPRDEV